MDMRVDLSGFQGIGLIVKAKTGVMYTSQVAGHGCEHPEVEGFFVPLERNDQSRILDFLLDAYRGSWLPLNEQQADALDRMLRRQNYSSIRVERALLHESREAWVHVVVPGEGERYVPVSTGSSEPFRAVLVWPNSD